MNRIKKIQIGIISAIVTLYLIACIWTMSKINGSVDLMVYSMSFLNLLVGIVAALSNSSVFKKDDCQNESESKK